jgi:hypothetical protein
MPLEPWFGGILAAGGLPGQATLEGHAASLMVSSAETLQAFGLSWRSAQLELPELPAGSDGPLVEVAPEDPQHWPPLPPGPHDTPFVQMTSGDLRLTVEGIGRFRVSGGERISWWREHKGVSDQDIRTFLLGSAVGALLIQRRMLVLHGNALEKDGQTIVCLGHSGVGKSTLAYALLLQGWRLLADDLVGLSPEGLVLPGIPRIKLWHDAARSFGIDPASLPPIRQGMRKYVLKADERRRAPHPMPLRALYLIRRQRHLIHKSGGKSEQEKITPVSSQQQAALLLRNHAYRPRFVRGLGQEGANFLALAQLQRRAPLAVLPLPHGIAAVRNWLAEQDLLRAAAQEGTARDETALGLAV